MEPGAILEKSARMYAANTAVTFDDRSCTYAELWERSCRLANALLGLGLQPGDRVAMLGDNQFETMEQVCGLALAGVVRCPMYTQNPVDVHLFMLDLVGASAFIVQDKYFKEVAGRLGEVPSLRHVIVVGVGDDSTLDYDQLVSSAATDRPGVRVHEDDNHIIRFSAGTTGRPKGIVHTIRGWMQMGTEAAYVLPRIEEEDAFLVAGPMSHASGLFVWPVLAHGARKVIMPTFDPARFLELVETERCTLSLLVPTMIQVVANHPDAKTRDLSSLKAIFYGAAPITERTLEEAQAVWGNIMYQLYGQSESLPVTVLTPRHHVLDGSDAERQYLRSAGRPTPNTLVKVLDDDGNELPVGEVGEICTRSPGNMKEIWGDADATRERITDEGFVRSRDLGYIDERGFVFLADRKEDMIISGGFNIWPAEVENALCSHPAVLEAVVVGVPHEKWGETVQAVVVLREGQTVSEDELIGWCRDKIGSVKKPTSVEFSTEPLPKSAVGKLLRRAVREQYWSSQDRRVGGV